MKIEKKKSMLSEIKNSIGLSMHKLFPLQFGIDGEVFSFFHLFGPYLEDFSFVSKLIQSFSKLLIQFKDLQPESLLLK